MKKYQLRNPTLERHMHQWVKIAGENKVYCSFAGCTKTQLMWEAGSKFPWTGKTLNNTSPSYAKVPPSQQYKVMRECFHCGVFLPVRADGTLLNRHVCDGAEGKIQRDRVSSEALGALNNFFFGQKGRSK